MSAYDDAMELPGGGGANDRIGRLEWIVPRVSAKVDTTADNLQKVAKDLAVSQEAQKAIAKDVSVLSTKLDRLTWAIVMLALTIAGSAVTLAITIAGGAG